MTRRLAMCWSLVATAGSLAGCVYYNAMWSAEHYAKDARHLEARGQVSEARSQWAMAASKAEAVVLHHPSSKWADDALVLQAEGLARSGACQDAEEPITRARGSVKAAALRERLELSAAECAMAAQRPVEAFASLRLPLASKDGSRRSRAEYLAGEAAMQRLDYDAAVRHLERSEEPAARPARIRAELLAGRHSAAVATLIKLGSAPQFETERADLLAELAAVAGPAAASDALDRMLRGRVRLEEQAKLLVADGDRRLAHGDLEAAAARFGRAAAVAPVASAEAGTALVGQQRVLIARAATRQELPAIATELTRILRVETGGGSAKRWLDLVGTVSQVGETPGMRFRAAEIARDSLDAPMLAGQLFLDAAARDTGSIFAPKALVAALALLPGRRDSIAGVLDTRYPASPYTHAFHGEPSVAYAAAEDSLARELGVQLTRATSPAGARFEPPIPGPRGPQLDEPAEDERRARAVRAQPRPTQPRAVSPGAPPPTPPPPPPAPAGERPTRPERP